MIVESRQRKKRSSDASYPITLLKSDHYDTEVDTSALDLLHDTRYKQNDTLCQSFPRGALTYRGCVHIRRHISTSARPQITWIRRNDIKWSCSSLPATNILNSRFSHSAFSGGPFLGLTSGIVRCSFQRQQKARFDCVCIACKGRKSMNDLPHTMISLSV